MFSDLFFYMTAFDSYFALSVSAVGAMHTEAYCRMDQ